MYTGASKNIFLPLFNSKIETFIYSRFITQNELFQGLFCFDFDDYDSQIINENKKQYLNILEYCTGPIKNDLVCRNVDFLRSMFIYALNTWHGGDHPTPFSRGAPIRY